MNFKDLKVFCISLNRRKDRRENIEKRLKDLSIEFEFFDAIDGSLLTESYQLPKGAIGCNLSHMNLYRSLADYDKPILIIEDDAEFNII
jgi:glycosyl transferase family 25